MGLRRFLKDRRLARAMSGLEPVFYHGLAVPLNRSGMIPPIAKQIFAGDYETPEISGLTRVVRAGDRILELGAGLGIISALAAQKTGPNGRLLCYEANPALIAATEAFWKSHDITNIELRNAVLVPDDPGTRSFHLAGSFAESSLLGAEGRDPQGEVVVRADLLADVCESFRPDVLICDIEGAEAQLIPAIPAIGLRAAVIEFHPDRLSGQEHKRIIDRLLELGLYPLAENAGGTVMVFERIAQE